MKICILETGLNSETLVATHGQPADQLQAWLRPELPEAVFSTIRVLEDAPLPASPAAFDGYLVTGSPHGVYEDLPWMRRLQAFLRAVAAAEVPMVGVCFGHQVMAAAFGGHVAKSPLGFRTGPQQYRFDPEFGLADGTMIVFHQDRVETLPEGAAHVGGNASCPIGAIRYRFPAISLQFHPEFDKTFSAALARDLAGSAIPPEQAEATIAALATAQVDARAVARRGARLFRDKA